MKKIISLIAILALVAAIFTLAACGNKATDDIRNEMTTLKDEGENMMDDMSEALSDIDSGLTEIGNVTDENSSTGLFEDMTSDKAEGTTTKTEDNTVTTGTAAE